MDDIVIIAYILLANTGSRPIRFPKTYRITRLAKRTVNAQVSKVGSAEEDEIKRIIT